MAALKVYTLGNHGFVTRAVADAVGSRGCQVSVLIIAHTKVEAIRIAADVEVQVGSNDAEFRQIQGGVYAASVLAAFDKPAVVVTQLFSRQGDPVVVLEPSGPRRVGSEGRDRGHMSVFVPEEVP